MHYSRLTSDGVHDPEVLVDACSPSYAPCDLTYNWWGSNSNPSSQVSGSTSFNPWLVLGITATPASITSAQTSAVQINLTFDSDGNFHDPAFEHVPDNIPVTYAVTPGDGSVSIDSSGMVSGMSQTLFTSSSTGYAKVSAIVDNQTVSVVFGTSGPTVNGISPKGGPTTGGTFVNITGSGFTGATAVAFGDIPESYFWIENDTSITAVSPGGTVGIVNITVTTPQGTSAIVEADQFTYKANLAFNITPSKIRTTDKVTFNVSESVDATQDSISWDFGDGTKDSPGKPVTNYSYSKPGSYTVKLTVTDAAGIKSSSSQVVNVTIPVVLVHGWHGSTESWTEMESQLKKDGFEVWIFDYENQNTDDPIVAANYLVPYIEKQRNDLTYNGQPYTGNIDIVCHSMGAIVSRYYMEILQNGANGKDVRQWIGIAPAHHGSGGADFQDFSKLATLYKLLWSDTALPQLKTTSPAVQALNGSRSPTTIYRVIAGYNPTHSIWFGKIGWFPALPATIAKRTSGSGSAYYTTFSGDMIVAIAQAYDSHMGFDAFPLDGALLPGQEAYEFDHVHITHSQQVIDRVIHYLKNIDEPLNQNKPIDEEIPGVIYLEGIAISVLCPVDISITDPEGHTINKLTNEIPGARYTELGLGHDGTPDAMIEIPERKVGDYLITVTPKPGASPTATFTLLLSLDGVTQTIADNVAIKDIPSTPYIFQATGNTPPVLTNPGDQVITEGKILTLNLKVIDLENDPVTYSFKSDKPLTAATLVGNIFTWTPPSGSAGVYSIIFNATDSGGLSDQKTIKITVDKSVITPASITVASPNGGEKWQRGKTYPITWKYTGSPGSSVSIVLFKGDSQVYTIASSTSVGTGGSGSFDWKIPSDKPLGSDYKVRIQSTSQPTIKDTSNNHFTITPATTTPSSITVTSPNVKETWQRGTKHTVTWSYTGNPGSKVKITLLKSGVEVGTISSSTSIGIGGKGSYSWPIYPTGSTGSDYKVKVQSISQPSIKDTSNAYFTLTSATVKPSITVTSPNGGETLKRGASKTITWNYAGSPGSKVKIVLLKGTTQVGTIASNVPIGSGGKGSYIWKISTSGRVGNNFKVNVQSMSHPTIKDSSNNYFKLIL